MTSSPVLVVPELAQAPSSKPATACVFTSGATGDGPFGYQPDIVDAPPNAPDCSPQRSVA